MLLPLLPKSFPPPPPVLPTEENNINIDWGSVLYVVLIWKQQDGVGRETKSLSWQLLFWMNPVWKLMMQIYVSVREAKKHHNTLSFITKLTSITNEDESAAESFPAVGDAFIRFMQQHAGKYEDARRFHQLRTLFLLDTMERFLIYLFLFIN
jgi:hypothetical protein